MNKNVISTFRRKLRFMAPAVPLLPCTAMFANTYLMLKLPSLTWARLGIWVFVGRYSYIFHVGELNIMSEEYKPKNISHPIQMTLPLSLNQCK